MKRAKRGKKPVKRVKRMTIAERLTALEVAQIDVLNAAALLKMKYDDAQRVLDGATVVASNMVAAVRSNLKETEHRVALVRSEMNAIVADWREQMRTLNTFAAVAGFTNPDVRRLR
jgi:cell division septum initiation protein DivIVA